MVEIETGLFIRVLLKKSRPAVAPFSKSPTLVPSSGLLEDLGCF